MMMQRIVLGVPDILLFATSLVAQGDPIRLPPDY